MPVTTVHPDYLKRQSQWKTMRDCIEGEDAIKRGGELYLPKATGSTPQRYEAYKLRARFVNYTKRTLDGLHGLMLRRDPIVEKPDDSRLVRVLQNVDKKGSSLYQFLSDSVYDVMITGWGGFLVDFPNVPNGTDGLTMEKEDIRPYIRYYSAESIKNWKYGVINGLEQLTMVTLEEKWESPLNEDPFSHDLRTVYRVLRIINGIYHQQLFYEEGDEPFQDIPVIINGEPLTTLPFFAAPSATPDVPMFLDLARCNIGHYQKTADYENGVHLTTLPTGYITGHDKYVDPETKEEEAVALGPDAFIMIKEAEAKVGVLNYAGTGLSHCEKALEMAMSDMAILGSRLVSPEKGTSESADSAKIHRAGENARLAGFAKNISESISKAVKTISDWMGIEGDFSVALCTDYDTLSFDPNALNALANLAEAGKLPLPYVFWNLKNGEYTPDTATLKEYIALLNMEAAGVDMFDEAEAYALMQQHKNILHKTGTSVSDLGTNKQSKSEKEEKTGNEGDEE